MNLHIVTVFQTLIFTNLKKNLIKTIVVLSLSHLNLCYPMDCSTPRFPVLHSLPEFAQTHIYWVSDVIQPSYPVCPFSSCPQSVPASGSFQWVSTSYEVAKVLEFQLHHQSFQCIFLQCIFSPINVLICFMIE